MTTPLRSPRLLLRPLRPDDLDDLARILAEPEVARWWPDFGRERIREEMIVPDPELVIFALEHEGRLAGLIQYGEETDPQYRHASIDLFLGASSHGAGLGPEAIRTLVAHLFDARGHHRLVIDPAADNTRAIRAYEKVGFRTVGTMRQYERGPDGTWRDGVLMELLARDFAGAGASTVASSERTPRGR